MLCFLPLPAHPFSYHGRSDGNMLIAPFKVLHAGIGVQVILDYACSEQEFVAGELNQDGAADQCRSGSNDGDGRM